MFKIAPFYGLIVALTGCLSTTGTGTTTPNPTSNEGKPSGPGLIALPSFLDPNQDNRLRSVEAYSGLYTLNSLIGKTPSSALEREMDSDSDGKITEADKNYFEAISQSVLSSIPESNPDLENNCFSKFREEHQGAILKRLEVDDETIRIHFEGTNVSPVHCYRNLAEKKVLSILRLMDMNDDKYLDQNEYWFPYSGVSLWTYSLDHYSKLVPNSSMTEESLTQYLIRQFISVDIFPRDGKHFPSLKDLDFNEDGATNTLDVQTYSLLFQQVFEKQVGSPESLTQYPYFRYKIEPVSDAR